MSLLSAARSTNIIALMSFASAFLFYQYTRDVRQGPWQDDSAAAGAGKTGLREPRTPQQMQEASSDVVKGKGDEGETRREGHLRQVGGGREGDDNTTLLLPVLKPSSGALLTKLDLSGYSKQEKLFLRGRMKELRKRATKLSKECQMRSSLRSSTHLDLLWHLQASPPLLYCPIHQVAAEAWTAILLRQAQLGHDDTEGRVHPPRQEEESKVKVWEDRSQSDMVGLLPPPEDPQEREAVFRDSLRMIVVRHPFSRIISVYRDKMTKVGPFNSLQRKIVSQYRTSASNNLQFPSFSEFVQYILNTTRNVHSREEWQTQERLWTPYWVLCNVCGADYNLVLQLETMQEDMKFLAKLTHMHQLGKVKAWQQLKNINSISLDLQKHYYRELPVELIQRFRDTYLLDLILFGYQIKRELKMYGRIE